MSISLNFLINLYQIIGYEVQQGNDILCINGVLKLCFFLDPVGMIEWRFLAQDYKPHIQQNIQCPKIKNWQTQIDFFSLYFSLSKENYYLKYTCFCSSEKFLLEILQQQLIKLELMSKKHQIDELSDKSQQDFILRIRKNIFHHFSYLPLLLQFTFLYFCTIIIMSCIFSNSKYYKQSKADPFSICPPLGYDFLCSGSNKGKQVLNMGQLVYRQVYDRSHVKVLSQKKTPSDKLQQFLKVSKLPRKNQYLSPSYLDFMRNNCSKQIFLSISRHFVPNYQAKYSMIQLSQLISNPRVQSITHIEDYSLSRFFYIYQGNDAYKINYLYEFLNRRLIQYDVQCQFISHSDKNSQKNENQIKTSLITGFEVPADIENVEEVKQLIKTINQINKKKDQLYCGVHLYFADFCKKGNQVDFFQRQVLHYSLLQYYITMMTGVLANGQTAIIKLNGAFKHKTFQMLFLLKLLFNGKVSLCKPLGSNPFLPESYVTCEYYNKTNGDIIHKYLLQNYHLLKNTDDEKWLLDPKAILKEDLHNNVKVFNQAIIQRGLQAHLVQFKNNSNIEFYPSKQKLMERPIKFSVDLQPMITQMICIPEKELEKMRDKLKEKDKKQQPKPTPVVSIPTPKGSFLSSGLFTKKKTNH